MKHWEKINLGDAATFINGYAFKPKDWEKEGKGGKEIIRIQNLTKSSKEVNYYNGTLPEKKKKKKGDLLISWSATLGVYEWKDDDAWLNQHIFKVVFDKKEFNKRFFKYVIQNSLHAMSRNIHGSTMKHITKKRFDNLQIPLPPLPTQKKIADLLDTADKLRQKTQAVIDHYDQLAQSLFLEMFGDPVKNPMGWEKEILEKLGTIVTGSTPPSSKEGMFGGHIPFITPADLESGVLHTRTVTQEGAKRSRVVRKGALMVCCIGTIGKKDIVKEPSAFNQQINAVEWNTRKVNDLYALHAFTFTKNEVIKRASSTTLPILKKSAFAQIKLAVPPILIQNQFAERIALIEQQKELAKKSLEESENLFNALMQKAFKGEIEVSEAAEVAG